MVCITPPSPTLAYRPVHPSLHSAFYRVENSEEKQQALKVGERVGV